MADLARANRTLSDRFTSLSPGTPSATIAAVDQRRGHRDARRTAEGRRAEGRRRPGTGQRAGEGDRRRAGLPGPGRRRGRLPVEGRRVGAPARRGRHGRRLRGGLGQARRPARRRGHRGPHRLGRGAPGRRPAPPGRGAFITAVDAVLAGARPGRRQIQQIHDAIDNATTTPEAASAGLDQVVANRQAALTGARNLSVTQTDQAGTIKSLLVESFQRSLDYDRDLQDGVAAYQNGRLRALPGQGLRRRRALQRGGHEGEGPVPGRLQPAARLARAHARRRRLLTMRRTAAIAAALLAARPRRGLRARGALADRTSAAPATTAAPPRATSEAERNASATSRAPRPTPPTRPRRRTATTQTAKPQRRSPRPPPAPPPRAPRSSSARSPSAPSAARRCAPTRGATTASTTSTCATRRSSSSTTRSTDTFQAAYATFANDVPDVELHELPGTCAHFIVDKDGTIYQLVALTTMCRHTVGLNWTRVRHRAGRAQRARDPSTAPPSTAPWCA